jgi:hypothetical protein
MYPTQHNDLKKSNLNCYKKAEEGELWFWDQPELHSKILSQKSNSIGKIKCIEYVFQYPKLCMCILFFNWLPGMHLKSLNNYEIRFMWFFSQCFCLRHFSQSKQNLIKKLSSIFPSKTSLSLMIEYVDESCLTK